MDAADAERRRIERDLREGAQQRLVSLAVNLGLAKATLTDLPDDARLVIEKAHYEAKKAIEELNDLVRGLHPAVLDDGVGGADPSTGTGLDGLAKRVASVDGRFSLSSPAGGPTVLSVELPCAL